MKLILAALVLSATLAPLAQAHVDTINQGRSLVAGPYYVYFEPQPTPPYAGQIVTMLAQISHTATGKTATNTPTSVLVAGPDFSERKTMESDGRGYFVASMTLPTAGNYSARVLVTDPESNETYAAQTEFEVYANIPYRINAVDQVVDAYEGETAKLAFEVVEPITLAPADLEDLSMLVQHWTEDHTTKLGEEVAQGTKAAPGVFRFSYTFPDKGMYHMRFASAAGEFNYLDTPPLHIYATSASEAALARDLDETPGPAIGGILVLLGIVAILRKR